MRKQRLVIGPPFTTMLDAFSFYEFERALTATKLGKCFINSLIK